MKLSDFVSQTITEICTGIVEAQKLTEKGTVIAPRLSKDGMAYNIPSEPIHPHSIKFNIMLDVVSSASRKSGHGEFSISVATLKLGAKSGQSETEADMQKHSSSVQFEIPVLWPFKKI